MSIVDILLQLIPGNRLWCDVHSQTLKIALYILCVTVCTHINTLLKHSY